VTIIRGLVIEGGRENKTAGALERAGTGAAARSSLSFEVE